MEQEEKLIELLRIMYSHSENTCIMPEDNNGCHGCLYFTDSGCDHFARDAGYLLANGVIVLTCKPLPCVKDSDPMCADVYCPYCGTNISGCYPNCDIDIVPCIECGTLLDLTKSVTRVEAEQALAERYGHKNENW